MYERSGQLKIKISSHTVHRAMQHPPTHTAVEMNCYYPIIQNNCILTIIVFHFPQWQTLIARWNNNPLVCINESFLEIQYSPGIWCQKVKIELKLILLTYFKISDTPFFCMTSKLVSMKQNTKKEYSDSKMWASICVQSVHSDSKMLFIFKSPFRIQHTKFNNMQVSN
jgi:hypothetical protein